MAENTFSQYPLVVNQKTAAEILGRSVSTITRWEKSGLLKRLDGFPSPNYSTADLQRLANAMPSANNQSAANQAA